MHRRALLQQLMRGQGKRPRPAPWDPPSDASDSESALPAGKKYDPWFDEYNEQKERELEEEEGGETSDESNEGESFPDPPADDAAYRADAVKQYAEQSKSASERPDYDPVAEAIAAHKRTEAILAARKKKPQADK